jgi:hypothetical protein
MTSTSFIPAVFASPAGSNTNSVAFNLYPSGAQVASAAALPKYALKLSFSPSSLSIHQAAGSGCQGYPVCGSGTNTLTLKNKGSSTFTTNGKCTFVVKPGPNGKSSEKFPCSGFPTGSIPAGGKAKVSITWNIYNWPDGTYSVHFTVGGKVGSTAYNSDTGTFTVVASGNP